MQFGTELFNLVIVQQKSSSSKDFHPLMDINAYPEIGDANFKCAL